ncbi:unnamed protein product [Mytilus coruscus]|uniref:Uncharacterized protein n=1 Tax=Mytilus coruscus TaxID=42192 RepID=A0A6J8E0Y9_MYTCO|nr:unnamed protein product [Mytilus coruscus]
MDWQNIYLAGSARSIKPIFTRTMTFSKCNPSEAVLTVNVFTVDLVCLEINGPYIWLKWIIPEGSFYDCLTVKILSPDVFTFIGRGSALCNFPCEWIGKKFILEDQQDIISSASITFSKRNSSEAAVTIDSVPVDLTCLKINGPYIWLKLPCIRKDCPPNEKKSKSWWCPNCHIKRHHSDEISELQTNCENVWAEVNI